VRSPSAPAETGGGSGADDALGISPRRSPEVSYGTRGCLGAVGLGAGYSNDLRVRVIRFIEKGAAARGAARHFEIGDSTAIRWVRRWRDTGSTRVKPRSRESRSPLKAHEQWLLDLVGREPDLTLNEIRLRLADEHGLKVGIGSVWRFFDRHGISFKKKRSRGRAGSA
jgi:transposase